KSDIIIIGLLMIFLFASTLSIAAMNIAYGSAAIVWVGRMIARRSFTFPRTPFDMFLAAYIVAETLSTIFAYNQPQSMLYMYRRVTLLPIIYIIFANTGSTRTLKLLTGAFIASVVFVSLWSLRDVILHIHEYVLFQRRLREFQMYMTAGGMMMFGMLLLLPFVVHAKTPPKIRWLALAAMVPVATNLFFTFTRSSWMGFLAGAIIIGTYRAKKIFLPMIIIIGVGVMFSSPEMQERMSSIFNPYHVNNISRLHMWQVGWKIFLDHPVLGIGDIGIDNVWTQYAPPDWPVEGHLHNNIITVLVTIGSLGFIALAALFIKLWLVVSQIEKRLHTQWFHGSLALGALAMFAGFHVNGMFEWNFGDAEIIMVVWAVTGLVLGAEKVAQQEGLL
ncbi:MAG: O-antigen ligase family protein, partial [bacterium]